MSFNPDFSNHILYLGDGSHAPGLLPLPSMSQFVPFSPNSMDTHQHYLPYLHHPLPLFHLLQQHPHAYGPQINTVTHQLTKPTPQIMNHLTTSFSGIHDNVPLSANNIPRMLLQQPVVPHQLHPRIFVPSTQPRTPNRFDQIGRPQMHHYNHDHYPMPRSFNPPITFSPMPKVQSMCTPSPPALKPTDAHKSPSTIPEPKVELPSWLRKELKKIKINELVDKVNKEGEGDRLVSSEVNNESVHRKLEDDDNNDNNNLNDHLSEEDFDELVRKQTRSVLTEILQHVTSTEVEQICSDQLAWIRIVQKSQTNTNCDQSGQNKSKQTKAKSDDYEKLIRQNLTQIEQYARRGDKSKQSKRHQTRKRVHSSTDKSRDRNDDRDRFKTHSQSSSNSKDRQRDHYYASSRRGASYRQRSKSRSRSPRRHLSSCSNRKSRRS